MNIFSITFVFLIFSWIFPFDLAAKDLAVTNIQNSMPPVELTISENYFSQGKYYIQHREWEVAIDCFTKAIILNPTNSSLYEYRAGSYFTIGEIDKAIRDYSYQVRLDPANQKAYLNRGNAFRASHELDKAILDFDECLRLNPTNGAAYKYRGAARYSKGEYNRAISDWSEGLRFTPNDDLTLAFRGFAYFMTGHYDKALNDYHAAIQINPTNSLAYNNLAWLLATCPVESFRNGEEAVKAGTKACELSDWKIFGLVDTLAAAYAEVGNFEQAIKYEKFAMSLDGISENDRKNMQNHLLLYQQDQPNHEGQKL